MNTKALVQSIKVESILFVRGFFGFFFTCFFPPMMLILFGSIYGNEPSPFYGGYGAMDVTVPSLIGLVVAVNGLMSFPMTLGEYKTNKVYKRFDATPAGKGMVIVAQLFVNVATTILGILLVFGLGKLIYNIQIEGSFFVIASAVILSIAAIFALGFCISAVMPNAKMINLVSYVLYFVMIFGSGATLPSEMFSENIRKLSLILPLTHVVDMMKKTFAGQSFADYWPNMAVLASCTLVFGVVGAVFFRKRRWK